jgi:hypothetical protein
MDRAAKQDFRVLRAPNAEFLVENDPVLGFLFF